MRGDSTPRVRGTAAAVLLIAALIGASAFISDAQVSPDVIQPAILKTVQLIILDKDEKPAGSCSGSFVNSSGLIMTAAHCVRATKDEPKSGIRRGDLYNPDGLLLVYINTPDRINPIPALMAQRVADSPDLDMALLKSVALLDRNPPRPLPADFRVPYGFMTIGDSNAVRIGEPIAVLGFPSLGGESITVVQGHVTGFDATEENVKTWLKNDAPSTRGHSGGPIINARGQEIAVVSHGRVDPAVAASYSHDALISRVPASWAQYINGGPVPVTASTPTRPGGAAEPSPPPRAPLSPSPAPQPPAAGFVIRGRVVDAGSGAGIAGAYFVIFRPGYTGQSEPTKADILAGGQTDGGGAFQTTPPVRKGATYPIAILARNYQTIFGRYEISAGAPDVIVPEQPFQLQGK